MASKVAHETETDEVQRAESELVAFFDRTLSPMTEDEQEAAVKRVLAVEVRGKGRRT